MPVEPRGVAPAVNAAALPGVLPVVSGQPVRNLVEAARAGDRDAFGALYGRFGSLVHGVLLARVPRDHVDDLLHDVFLLAMRRLDQLRDDAAFGAWIATIARHRAADFHRRGEEHVELDEDVPAAPAAPTEEARRALDVIRSLPKAYRETLVLRLVEGLTGPEIAERTGLTPGSVRVNLHRGMRQLRARLEEMNRVG